MKFSLLSISFSLILTIGNSQIFAVKDSGIFIPEKKKVILYQNTANKNLILFKTNLQVNTDGIPVSYHPFDLRGDSIAINTILNGAAIYRLKDNIRISNPKKPNNFSEREKIKMREEAFSVFEKFRDSNYEKDPEGYRINWRNVLIADSTGKPCIFKTGKYKGYFASATALKNELTGYKGECDCNNQVNPFEIPALVLAGGQNIVSEYGAKLGDLVVAYNLTNQHIVYAIIGDTGPEGNLGEGSVILNMKLLGKTVYPKTKKETYKLATGKDMMVCILPNSNSSNIVRPYTQENIKERISNWFKEQGYNDEQKIRDIFEKNKTKFK
jgi:hypothetical protein